MTRAEAQELFRRRLQEMLREGLRLKRSARASVAREAGLDRATVTRMLKEDGAALTPHNAAAVLWACGFALRFELQPLHELSKR